MVPTSPPKIAVAIATKEMAPPCTKLEDAQSVPSRSTAPRGVWLPTAIHASALSEVRRSHPARGVRAPCRSPSCSTETAPRSTPCARRRDPAKDLRARDGSLREGPLPDASPLPPLEQVERDLQPGHVDPKTVAHRPADAHALDGPGVEGAVRVGAHDLMSLELPMNASSISSSRANARRSGRWPLTAPLRLEATRAHPRSRGPSRPPRRVIASRHLLCREGARPG